MQINKNTMNYRLMQQQIDSTMSQIEQLKLEEPVLAYITPEGNKMYWQYNWYDKVYNFSYKINYFVYKIPFGKPESNDNYNKRIEFYCKNK